MRLNRRQSSVCWPFSSGALTALPDAACSLRAASLRSLRCGSMTSQPTKLRYSATAQATPAIAHGCSDRCCAAATYTKYLHAVWRNVSRVCTCNAPLGKQYSSGRMHSNAQRAGSSAHPLTLTMKDATTQAPSCVARELTKCGPMMRRDDVSVIT